MNAEKEAVSAVPERVLAANPGPAPWRAFRASLLGFQKDKITPWIGLRNTLGVAIPLSICAALGSIPMGLALATGALNVSYSDSQDGYLLRRRKMLSASLLVALAVFLGALCGKDDVLSIALAGAAAFVAGLLVALSSTAADLGVITVVTLVVYSAVPQTPERAVYAGLLALGGGFFQAFLSLALELAGRYSAERRVLGNVLTGLAGAAASPVEVFEAPPASASFTEAQNTIAELDRDYSIAAERNRMLLSQAERMRLALMALRRLRVRLAREDPAGEDIAILDRFLLLDSDLLRKLGVAVAAGEGVPAGAELLGELQKLADAMRERKRDAPPERAALISDANRQMDALTGQLRSAFDLGAHMSPPGREAFDRKESARPWRLQLAGPLATLRANLSLQSTAFRHAVRMAACVALGDAIARAVHARRPYWIPMTIIIVLKPDFGSTFSRGVLRLCGTFAGLVIATGLFHLLPGGNASEIAAIAILMFLMRCFGSANYGVFTLTVTALVVFLISLTGVAPKDVMLARGINTFVGGTIALAAYWLWPSWERALAPQALAGMLDAYRLYFRAVRESYLNPGLSHARPLDRTRLEARRARSNLEASIDRLCGEPGTPPSTVSALGAILASSHRLIHAIMALEAGLAASEPVPARPAFRPFANDAELTLYYLAAALRGASIGPAALPDLREDYHALVNTQVSPAERYALVNVETDRITNSLNTLSRDVFEWVGTARA